MNTPGFKALLALLLFAPSVHAYLDPGTGSMIVQGMIAGILSLGFTIKLYWGKIKGYWATKTGKDISPDTFSTEDASKTPAE